VTKQLAILLITILTITSCSREVDPGLDDYQQKLVINAELQPDKPVYLFVSTSIGITSELDPFHPTDSEHLLAEIIVNGDEDTAETITYFEKEEEDGGDMCWRTRRAFRPEAGQSFELRAELLQHNEIYPVSAQTYIPEPCDMISAYVGKESNTDSQAQGQYRIDLTVEGEVPYSESYFHLLAKKDGEYLDLSSFGKDADAVENPYHHFGVLVNGSKLNSNSLNFLVESIEDIDDFELELRNCTESYFNYHVSLSRSYAAQSSPYNEPTLNFTNIQDGLGVFTAYSVTNQEVTVK